MSSQVPVLVPKSQSGPSQIPKGPKHQDDGKDDSLEHSQEDSQDDGKDDSQVLTNNNADSKGDIFKYEDESILVFLKVEGLTLSTASLVLHIKGTAHLCVTSFDLKIIIMHQLVHWP